MKKILVIFISLISMMIMVPTNSYAQSKALDKELNKEYKKKLKEYKKEGWKLFGSSRTLEVVLLSHYEKLNSLGAAAYEVSGTGSVTDSKHKNLLHQQAQMNAYTKYAGEFRQIVGRAIVDMGLADEEKSEFEHFYAAYESKIEREIKGELRESYAIIKEVSDNQIDMQVFYVVDVNSRIRAFEQAAKESAVAQKYASQVSDFIKEGFKNQ
jgi:uncharacterized membrane-anchored protein YhcB (DUF1043 family)